MFTIHSFSASEVPTGRDAMLWGFDFSGNGEQETLSCGFWARWGLLTHCEVEFVARQAHQSAPLPQAQCKEIGVLADRVNGFNQLVCDFDEVYQMEPEFGAFLPVNAQRMRVQSGLRLNVRSGPSADRDRIATLPASTRVVVLDSLGDWVRIVAPPSHFRSAEPAWVNGNFLVAQ